MSSALLVSEIEARVRDNLNDTDSANYAIDTPTTMYRWINRGLVIVKGDHDDRTLTYTATQSGAVATTGMLDTTLSVATIIRVEEAFLTATNADITPVTLLDRASPSEVLALQMEQPTLAQPLLYATRRAQSPNVGADVGKHVLSLWPVPDTNYNVALRCLIEPTLVSSSSERPDISLVDSFA